MTEIVTVDAEVVVPLDTAAAKRLDFKIRLMAGTIRDNIAKIADLIEEAKNGEIHRALGFSSWTSYVADALGGQLELTTDNRRAVVALMAGEGMSQRAIAQAVGVNHATVSRDQAVIAEKVLHDATPDLRITGRDDKTYPRPVPAEPKPRRRRPITDAFETGIFDLNKVIGRLTHISNDDRFGRNAEALRHRSNDLIRARDAIDLMVARLDPDEFIAHSDRQDAAAVRVVRELFAAVEAVTDDA